MTTYKLLFLLPVLAGLSGLLAACGGRSPRGEGQITAEGKAESQYAIDSLSALCSELDAKYHTLRLLLSRDQVGIWGTKWNEERRKDDLVFVEQIDDTTSLHQLVEAFNRRYPPPDYPGIEVIAEHDNTAFIRVLDGDLLTQRMGTTGASSYLAGATYSLTSIDQVEGVTFVFEEGDHARPGLYSRASWLVWFDYL